MTPGTPYIDGLAYVPLSIVGKLEQGIVRKLTIRPRGFQGKVVKPILTYNYDVPGMLGMPIDFAINTFENVVFEDRTIQGGECYYNKLPDPNHPLAASGQAKFMEDMDYAAANYFTFIAKAPTGSGKTAVALRTAALRGRRTLIIVQTEQLARQWANAIEQHLGIPKTDIGWVQSNTLGIEHPFVISIAHSVAGRLYPPEFYRAFGTIIYDEVHRVGAALFAQTVGLFPANLKIGLTATDRRKDNAEAVFFNYFGHPKVIAKTVIRNIDVQVIEYDPAKHRSGVCVPHWKENSGLILGDLCKDPNRNQLILKSICAMWDAGRTILVIGDRVQHLQELRRLCLLEEIPADSIGMFVNELYTEDEKPSFVKPKTWRPGEEVFFYKKEDHQLAYKQRLVIKRQIGRSVEVYDGSGVTYALEQDELRSCVLVPKKQSVTNEELDRIKRESLLVFATFGMFKEGQDIARLDAGIDVTPRADGEQAIGRVRRPYTGAPDALWYTIADQGHPTIMRWTKSRIKDYQTAAARISYYGRVG